MGKDNLRFHKSQCYIMESVSFRQKTKVLAKLLNSVWQKNLRSNTNKNNKHCGKY